jgi:hypothetical protein
VYLTKGGQTRSRKEFWTQETVEYYLYWEIDVDKMKREARYLRKGGHDSLKHLTEKVRHNKK